MKIAFIIISLTFITSSYILYLPLKSPNSTAQFQPGEFNLEDTTYFTLVRDYIGQNGEVREVNASSTLDKEMMITYHFIFVDGMEVSIDYSDRIYMSLNHRHYGNILKEKGKVSPEVIYGVPDKNPQETKEKESRILAVYRELIVLALKN